MKKEKRAQISVEFILYIGLTIVATTLFLAYIAHNLLTEKRESDIAEMQNVAEKIANEIYLATVVEDGYARTFEVPNTINGKAYFLNITNRTIILKTDKYEYNRFVDININGTIKKGQNNITNNGGIANLNT
jgi:uncharacterized protein (UPF0333 family)